MKEKRIIIALFVLGIIFSLMGGTLAFINWQTTEAQQTAVTFTVTPNFSCSADAGGHITSNNRMLAPTDCMDPEYAIQRTITTSSTTSNDKVISMDLWLNVNHVDANLLNSPNFKYAITKNKNSCTSGIINSGVINEDIQNNKINLLEGVEYATLNDTYYLYIWLDEAETNTNTMNQSFDLSIDGQCNDNGLEKTTMVDLNNTNYFKEADYITKITEIHFVYDKDLPDGVIENQVEGKSPYQLSTKANKPIYGYLNKIGDTDTYKLYITSAYKIYAQRLSSAFSKMTALQTIRFDNIDTSGTITMNSMFNKCSSLTSLDLSNFNTSSVTDMRDVFNGCSGLTSLNVSFFNTSNVIYFGSDAGYSYGGMFQGCSNLTTLDLSSFDTSSGQYMDNMFMNCSKLTSLDLSSFDTSNVKRMLSMFLNCGQLSSLDISNFNTSKVITMENMFYNCSKLTSLDVTSFNTSKVTSMKQMFRSVSSLTELDLSSFDTSLVSNMDYMLSYNTKLEKIYVSDLWNTDAVTSYASLFWNDKKLVGGNGTPYNTSNNYLTYARVDNPPDSPGYFTYKAYNN